MFSLRKIDVEMRGLAATAVIGLTVMLWAHHRLSSAFPWRFSPLNELVVNEHYLEDMGMLGIGAHRLAADIAYIQLLQYYGMEEPEEDDPNDKRPDYIKHDFSMTGRYPRLLELAQRHLRLDPFFNAAVLEMAGALAFNQKRINESLDLLAEGIRRDPAFYRYRIYIAAILFKQKGDDRRLIGLLEEAFRYPDCPVMLKLILGNLLRRTGKYEEAATIYLTVMRTAGADFERHDALERLRSLLRDQPALIHRLQLDAMIN